MQPVPERTVAIYVVSHLEGREEEISGHRWVYAGAAGRQRQASHLTDVCASGSSLENTRWSELSAIYKIWKEGPKTDVVGFCHYRRFFCFEENPPAGPVITIERSEIATRMPGDWQKMISLIGPDRSVVTREFDLGTDIVSHYAKCHNVYDYISTMMTLVSKYPRFHKHVGEQFESRQMHACNMFIMTWENFDALCLVWFDVLQAFAKATPWPRENAYQSRDVSFLAERLFDVWIRYKRSTGHSLLRLPMYFVTEPAPQ